MRDKTKKLFFFLLIFFLFLFNFLFNTIKTWAWEKGPTEIGLFVSERDLSVELHQKVSTYSENPLYLGGTYFYSKKVNTKAQLGTVYIVVKDVYQKEINFGVGFQGAVGSIKNKNNNENFDIFSVGFKLLGEWNVTQSHSEAPFSFNIYLFYSPPILNFSDIERIITARVGLNYYVTTTAAIGLRYQYSKIFIDDENNNLNWENSIIMLGILISF